MGTTFAKVVNDRVALKRRKYNTAYTVHGTLEERTAIEAQAEAYRRAKAGDEDEAAAFLRCHPEELRRRAKAGEIPGAKVGRAWVFLQVDLGVSQRRLCVRRADGQRERAERCCRAAAVPKPSAMKNMEWF